MVYQDPNLCYQCHRKSEFRLEWWGFNQQGKDPEVIQERYVCKNAQEILTVSREVDLGIPDGIYSSGEDVQLEFLLEALSKAWDHPQDDSLIKRVQREIDYHGQLELPLHNVQLGLF